VLFRNCLIGSIIFHVVLVAGVGFCQPHSSLVKPRETFLQIYTEPTGQIEFATDHREITAQLALQKPDLIETETTSAVIVKGEQRNSATKPSKPSNSKKEGNPVATKKVTPIAENDKAANEEKLGPNSIAVEQPEASGSNLRVQLPEGVDNGSIKSSAAQTALTLEAKSNGQGLNAQGRTGTDFCRIVTADLPVVDIRPVRKYCPQNDYPSKARQNNWEGVAVLLMEVRANGRIGQVKLLRTSGYDLLDQEAIRTVKKWRYQPGLKDGQPVACSVQFPFIFKLKE
jgi:protein TonB